MVNPARKEIPISPNQLALLKRLEAERDRANSQLSAAASIIVAGTVTIGEFAAIGYGGTADKPTLVIETRTAEK